MHNDLKRFCSLNLEQIPHHELLIITHGLAIELMISCALPSDITSTWQPFLVKEEQGKEYKIFKGLIDIYILKVPSQLGEASIAFETSNEIANAVGLPAFADTIRSFAKFERIEGKSRIIVQGAMGLTKLQGSMGEFFRKNYPDFQLPIGLDTEVYVRPQKFEKKGFLRAAEIT